MNEKSASARISAAPDAVCGQLGGVSAQAPAWRVKSSRSYGLLVLLLLLGVYLPESWPDPQSPAAVDLDQVLAGFDDPVVSAGETDAAALDLDEVLAGFGDEGPPNSEQPANGSEGGGEIPAEGRDSVPVAGSDPAQAMPAAPNSNDLDRVLQGFDDIGAPVEPASGHQESQPQPSEPNVDQAADAMLAPVEPSEARAVMSGLLSFFGTYSFAHDRPPEGQTDYRGWSRLESQIQLNLDVTINPNWSLRIGGHGFYDAIYGLNGRSDYTSETLSSMESEVELDEAYVSGLLSDHLAVKVGRQINVWGVADTLRINDIWNPLDLRRPGMAEVDQMRLPLTMSRVDFFGESFNVGAVAANEMRFNKEPAYGSEYYPYQFKLPPEDKPSNNLKNTEYGLAVTKHLEGGDLSFYWAHFYSDLTTYGVNDDIDIDVDIEDLPDERPIVVRKHDRLTLFGAAADLAYGNWLFKAEAAYFDGFEYVALPQQDVARIDGMLGVDYMGFPNTLITVESVIRHIRDYDDVLDNPVDNVKENGYQTIVRVQRDLLRDRLQVVGFLSVFGPRGQEGGFYRVTAEYDITDHLSVLGGVAIYYDGDDPLFDKADKNDRLFFQVNFGF